MTELRTVQSAKEILTDSTECFTPIPSSQYTFEGREAPLCQVGEDVYIDLNRDGNFSLSDDWFITPEGSGLCSKKKEIDARSLYSCWSDSLPKIYPSSYTLQQGFWPRRFTVLASSREGVTTLGHNFLVTFGSLLYSATSPEESYRVFHQAATGLRINDTWVNNLLLSLPVRLGIISNRNSGPQCSEMQISCSPGYRDSEGILGREIGFLYNSETVLEEAQKRYLLLIESDLYDTFWFNPGYGKYDQRQVTETVNELAGKYQLPADHVRRISQPKSFEALQKSLQTFSATIPADEKSELLIIYTAHGNTGDDGHWYTTLREGFWPFSEEIIIKENEFRELFANVFPERKFPSTTIVVHTCHASGVL